MDNFFASDNSYTNIFIYLDSLLINGLSSVFLNGYIQKITVTKTVDNYMSGRIDDGLKTHDHNEYTKSKQRNKQEITPKSNDSHVKSKSNSTYCCDEDFRNESLEGRRNVRLQESNETIYTCFSLHRELHNYMNSNSIIKNNITKDNIMNMSFNSGDYIEIKGEITCISMTCYLDYLITIIDSFNTPENVNLLDNLLKENNPGIWTYNSLLKVLIHFKETLSKQNTGDVIVNCGEKTVVLTVIDDNFLESKAHIFDKSNCCLTIFGKVLKHCSFGESLSLIRKTGHPDYYEGFLNNLEPYLQILRDNGISIPEAPKTNYDENTLFIIPISIYI